MKRIFGAAGDLKNAFLQGFKMGAMVGGIFGGLTGLYYAITTRSFMYIPMIALTSGASFGFFMGMGMIMRSEMEEKDCAEDDVYRVVTIEEGAVSYSPIYKQYQV